MDIKKELKQTLISELNLEDLVPDDIDDSAPLFGATSRTTVIKSFIVMGFLLFVFPDYNQAND